MTSWSSVLAALLRETPVAPIAGVETFWSAFVSVRSDDPFVSAVRGGGQADRIGWAFAAGYESALAQLIETHDPAQPAALCVTESGPPHPRHIEATWDGTRLSGHKRYVTLGAKAELLYVLARSGVSEGRPQLTLLRVASDAAGLTLLPGKPTPFVPEVPHAEVKLDGVAATPLEGDGWSDYVKPFRTVEDLYVHAAVLAYGVAALVRCSGDRAAIEDGVATLSALRALALEDPREPSMQLAVHGAMQSTAPVFDALAAAPLAEEERARLERDRRLLRVASTARAARRERAWQAVSGHSPEA